MNKKLDSVFKEMFEKTLSAKVELIKKYASLSIPGFLTFDGKDIENDFFNREDLSSFIQDNFSKFETNIEKFYKHIEDILSNNNSEDAVRECLEKSEALSQNSEQTTQILLCICSAVRKIIFSINELLPSKPDDSDKETIELIKCVLERMLEANVHYEGSINDSINTFFQKDLEKDLEKYQDKKALLSVCYRQMYASSMSLLSQMSFDSMIVVFLYQKVDEYFNGPEENKSSLEAIFKQLTSMNDMMVANNQQVNRKLDTMGKTTEQTAKTTEQIKETSVQTLKNTQASIELEKTIISNQVVDKEENSQEHARIIEEGNKRNRLECTKPLKLTTCLEAIIEVYSDPKYNYPQQFILHQYAIRNQLSDWNQYLKTGGNRGKAPLPEFDFYRHTDKESFKKWVRDVFFPDYRERAHKDALTNASHPDNIDNIYVPAQQDIIDEVDESLASDDHYNPDTNNK